MRKTIQVCSVIVLLFLLIGNAQAYTVTINDNYVGAAPTNSAYNGNDIIGHDYYFDISKMDVTFLNGGMNIDIFTRYLNNIGQYQTQLGDLFISTNGWNPYGVSPYKDDKYGNGEVWEYALVMDTHSPANGIFSGTASLYQITDPATQIKLSWAPSGYVYRAGQEIQFIKPNGLNPIASGEWFIVNRDTSDDNDDYLRFAINYNFGTTDFGFHWTMTCANDVIEGKASAPVPEPATMLLLGSGLIGLIGLRRRFKKG